jgi:formamidopyrimidine-DNA glycosylase
VPELPEVETVRRGLAPTFEGSTLLGVELRRADLRFPFPENFAARLAGRRVRHLGRRAKYLVAEIEGGDRLVMHLGMSGSFRIDAEAPVGEFYIPRGKAAAHDHVVFHFASGARVTYNDPRRFGYMLLEKAEDLLRHPLFAELGAEPLDSAMTPRYLAAAFSGRKTPIKAALLDQRVVAGLGNIYVCEALHRASISPMRSTSSLVLKNGRPTKGLERLTQAIRSVLEEAIAAGGSSISDHRLADGSLGYFQHRFRVYDREGAACMTPGCPGSVARVRQAGRSSFYCPTCQK